MDSQRLPVNNQRFLLPDAQSAAQFLSFYEDDRREDAAEMASAAFAGNSLANTRVEDQLSNLGGQRSFRSRFKKEQHIYGNQETVWDLDLEYLHNRDPTVRAINHRPAEDTWYRLPETSVESIDEWFTRLMRMKYHTKAISADALGRAYGGAFLYINASGDVSEEIPRRGGEIHGFTVIHPLLVADDSVEWDNSGRRIYKQHGIKSIRLNAKLLRGDENIGSEGSRARTKPIDGSRLIHFSPDASTEHWRGKPKILPAFDTINDLRDIIYGQTKQQFEGSPIAITITEPEQFALDAESEEQLEQDIQRFVSGGGQFFSPVKGATVQRVGDHGLADPETALHTVASRIAQDVELPKQMILATAGNDQAIDESTAMTYSSRIAVRRNRFAFPILQHLTLLGQWVRDIPATEQLPLDLDWPSLRMMSARERAYVRRTNSMALDVAEKWNRGVDKEVEEMFPQDGGSNIESRKPDQDNSSDGEEMDSFDMEILHRLDRIDRELEDLQ